MNFAQILNFKCDSFMTMALQLTSILKELDINTRYRYIFLINLLPDYHISKNSV